MDTKLKDRYYTSSCAHPGYCYVVWVTSEIMNMFLHPLHSNALVTKAIVGLVSSIPQFLRGQKAESPKTITRLSSVEFKQDYHATYLIETATMGKFFSTESATNRL